LAWVGIAAGVVFVVAVVFFSGFYIGRQSAGDIRMWHYRDGGGHPGMMIPGQSGPNSPMMPGMMMPGMMGPQGPAAPGQPPATTTSPRP
jgi:hypothetical protein